MIKLWQSNENMTDWFKSEKNPDRLKSSKNNFSVFILRSMYMWTAVVRME